MNNTNLLLWEVHFMSSYYDDGTVPVDKRFFVVADNHDQAIEKSKPELKKLKNEYPKHEIKAIPMPMEILIVSRDSSNDGRLGYHSINKLQPVSLSLAKDNKEYKLVVCLIPKN